MNTITFVSGNPNKLRELQSVLAGTSLNVENWNFDLPELQGTPESVATAKCKAAFIKLGKGPVIIEDTSLGFNALCGLPGVYIRDFYEKLGNVGLVTLLAGHTDKNAQAMCIFAYTENGEDVILFTGKTNGRIVDPRGDTNFGWDPIFECSCGEKTFAEMTLDAKNQVSHRGKALGELKNYFLSEKSKQ